MLTLSEILKNSVRLYPNHIALIMRPRYRTMLWTYQHLAQFAQKSAELLKESGIQPGDPVLLWAPNSPYWVGSYFGILFRGAVVVPLHVENTQEFISKVAEQTSAKVILKSYRLKCDIKELKTIDIDLQDVEEQPFSGDYSIPSVKESDLAEIMYTSGTTGDPKGVMLTHKNIMTNVQSLAKAISIGKQDRFLSILPLSHMFEQVTGMLFPLSGGASIVYLPRIASGLITKALQEHRVTKLLAVPQFLDTVMKKIEMRAAAEGKEKALAVARNIAQHLPFLCRRLLFHKIHKRFGGRLTLAASGGAPLSPELEKKWELLGIHLFQGYGLTETAPVVSANTYHHHRFSSIGKALDGVQVKIAEDGEILVKGPNVFPGYFKNGEKTHEAFTPDGWYKTGDMGEIDPDGFIYIRGRKKYMILGPGGQNVYPEDIEFELNKQPGVKDSTVVGLERGRQTVIQAVLVLEETAQPEHIVENANKKLSEFQRVQGYSIWPDPDFPRSATKKVQKEKVLNWLKQEKPEFPAKIQTITPLTKLVADLFERNPVALHSDLCLTSDLGLDSILRIELVTRIEEVFGVMIEERFITPKTTIKGLEELIQKIPAAGVKRVQLKHWPFFAITQWIRAIGHELLLHPFMSLFIRLEVQGAENLQHLQTPVLLMPNHRSYSDSPIVFWSLPFRLRWQTAIATALDMRRYYWWMVWFWELFYGSFPFPRREEENMEAGLEIAGKLLDRKWSIVVFPEGRISQTAELLPLKRGAGLLAAEMGVPVVPVFIEGTEKILPYEKVIPRSRGKITVRFGQPLYFQKTDSYIEATEKIQKALQSLRNS